jgi:hypothetical protein
VKVNKLRDFAERVGWTAIYAAAAAGITELTSTGITWGDALKFVGVSSLLAVLKVVVAQNASPSGDGSALPGGVTKP